MSDNEGKSVLLAIPIEGYQFEPDADPQVCAEPVEMEEDVCDAFILCFNFYCYCSSCFLMHHSKYYNNIIIPDSIIII